MVSGRVSIEAPVHWLFQAKVKREKIRKEMGKRKAGTNMPVMRPSALHVMPQPVQNLLQSAHTMLLLLATLHTKSTSAAYATAASTRHAPQNTRVLKRVIPSPVFLFFLFQKAHSVFLFHPSKRESALCSHRLCSTQKERKRAKPSDVTVGIISDNSIPRWNHFQCDCFVFLTERTNAFTTLSSF